MVTSSEPRVEDLASVGSRVSWSAILAGAAVALAVQFLLGIVAAAAGLSFMNRVDDGTIRTSAIVLAMASTCLALFVGGLVATQLTAGENKVEAAIYGIVTWAVVMAIVAHSAVAGQSAFGMPINDSASARNWDVAARNAGVPADQIQQWRGKLAENRNSTTIDDRVDSHALWYAFATIWLSMFAATAGALVGAGPTFRLVSVGQRLVRPAL